MRSVVWADIHADNSAWMRSVVGDGVSVGTLSIGVVTFTPYGPGLYWIVGFHASNDAVEECHGDIGDKVDDEWLNRLVPDGFCPGPGGEA